ncbi:MAG: hypothetical protein H7Z72_14010, partial [Bacteroidetes bacterium]|nr:hypothetical protein [Fibrella sp.]
MVKSLRTLVCLVALLGVLTATGQAQSLVTGALSASFVCPPGTLSVPFSATGPFGAGNVFTAQLSDGSGNFSATPTAIGSLTANPASATVLTITATIPASTPTGAAHKVRVISSVGSRTSVSPTNLVIGTAAPSAPATTPSFCKDSGPASVSATGQNLKWYATNSTTVVAGSGATLPVSTTAVNTFSVFVTQTINSCESARTQVNYRVTAPPAAPGVTSISICQGQSASPLSASLAAGATPNWYGTNSTGGTASGTAPTPSTTSSATYYVSQTAGGCESGRSGLTVTVAPALTAPVVSVTPTYCANIAVYPVATATGSGLQWYNALGEAVGNTAPVPTIASVASYSYSVTQSSGTCISPNTNYAITVNPKATTPTLATLPYCANTPPVSFLVTGSNLLWFSNAAGTMSITQPVPLTVTQTIYVQQTDANGCKSDIATLTATVNAQPPRPAVTPAVAVCAGTTAVLTATALTGNTLRWYGSNPQGSYTTAPVATTAAGLQYVSQAGSSGCESEKAQINVVVNALPDLPTTSTPAPFCSGQAVGPLSATTTTAGASLRWYTDATTATFSTSALQPSNLANGTYYVAQIDVNGCVGRRASIALTLKKRPGAPTLSVAQSQVGLCQNQA